MPVHSDQGGVATRRGFALLSDFCQGNWTTPVTNNPSVFLALSPLTGLARFAVKSFSITMHRPSFSFALATLKDTISVLY
jgi:hypothetical protein